MTESSIEADHIEFPAALRIAVLVPCYNEAKTIASVIEQFRAALPQAALYVFDNNSSDGTADIARAHGAIVRVEKRQGKGFVIRRMFADIEADVYITVDGDATYEAAAAPRLVKELLDGPYDQVNGARVHQSDEAYRPGHVMGNKILSGLVAHFFGARNRDMLSGYKAFSRRFVKSFPASSMGFEIETELLVHALDMNFPISEIETVYKERPVGSVSKLSTFRDGFRILYLIMHLIRDLMPLQFFCLIGALCILLSLILGLPIVNEFFQTGLVPRLPTALLASDLSTIGFLSAFSGFILDSVARGRHEAKLLRYLSYHAANSNLPSGATGNRQSDQIIGP